MNVHPAEFGAAVKDGENLPRVQRPFGIKGTLKALLLLEIRRAEHHAHEIALFHADPVLAGEDSADLNTEFQDLSPKFLRHFEFARLIGIVENQGMEVAITCVKDVGDP